MNRTASDQSVLARCAAAGALLLVVAGTSPAQNSVYKWVDDQNRVHYSDRPPEGQESKAEEVATVTRSSTHHAATAAATPAAAKKPDAANPQAGEEKQKVAADVAAVKDEECKKARGTYDSYIHSRRIFRTDEKGERVYLSDAEIDQARVDALKLIDATCGAGP